MKAIALVLLLAACTFAGCTTRYLVTDRAPQAYYRTSFAVRDVSEDLEDAFRSVKRIQVTASYTTTRFALRDSITAASLRAPATWRRALEQYGTMPTKVGTATVIDVTDRNITLITNDHVVRLPDTVIVYFPQRDRRGPSPYVESVSVRTAEQYLVLGLPENDAFRIIARDSALDLAAVSVRVAEDATTSVPVIPFPMGDPSKLTWGSLVYVLGYPGGFRMVTRGIVSDPNRNAGGSFLLDGLFNRGISGGLILAVRGDTDALEWVGMAASAAATPEYLLMPEPRNLDEDGLLVPYDGALYIERASRLHYGITFPVPMTVVQQFLRNARVPYRLRTAQERASAAS